MAENRELALVLKLVADQFQSELKKSGGALGEFNKFISDWKVQLTAVGTTLFAVARSTANYGEELLKTSQKIGIKVEALAGLEHAAKLADVSNESLAKGLKTLSVNMVEAARQTGDGEALFRRLGVSATEVTGQLRPTEQVLLDLADVFANSKDGAGKAEAAVKLFGKAGLDLIPFLNQGKVGIKELMAEAERLGLVMSQQDAESANRFNDEIKKLEAATRGLTMQLGKELIPAFTQLLSAIKDLAAGPVSAAFKLEMQGLASIFTLLSHGVKETAAEIDVFFAKIGKSDAVKKFYDDVLVQSRKALDEGTSKKLSQIFTPLASSGANASGSTESGKQEISVLADQEKLGKAKLEIFLATNRAIDIRNKLVSEEADGYRQLLEFQIQEEKNEEDRQERLGKNIVQQTSLEVKIREDALAKERDGLAQNAQAWLDFHAQVGGSSALRYDKELALLQANLSKQLDLTQSETARLLVAWQQHDSQVADDILATTTITATARETIELQSLAKLAAANQRASDDVFAGWAKGMQDYVGQTGNGFNLATDMARQTAQSMEHGFKTFFFDIFEGRVNSLKDVLRSVTKFAEQIIAQISAQLVTKKILGLFSSSAGEQTILSGPTQAATGGEIVRRFAFGGPVPGFGTGDTVPALLTPGEFVLSRRDVSDIKRGIVGGAGSPINIAITVNAGGGSQQSGAGAAPNLTQLARDISRYVEAKLIDEQRPGGLLA